MLCFQVQACLKRLGTLGGDSVDVRAILRSIRLGKLAEGQINGQADGVPFVSRSTGRTRGRTCLKTSACCKVASDEPATEAVSCCCDVRGIEGFLHGGQGVC